jgi:8-oxo-dGTP pyrophosphatase MutT (NUDIX family)
MQALMSQAGMSVNESKKKRKRPGAGFVVVRRFEDDWKVLGLRLFGNYDLPKGGVERKDGGNLFVTAQRECLEECGVQIRESDLTWGSNSIQARHITIFLAETTQDPQVQKNEKSGIYEHHSADWLDWDDMERKVRGYLSPAVAWARAIVEGQ